MTNIATGGMPKCLMHGTLAGRASYYRQLDRPFLGKSNPLILPGFGFVRYVKGPKTDQSPSRFVVYTSLPSSRDSGREYHYPGDLRYSQRQNWANDEQGWFIIVTKLQPRCSIPSHNLVRCWPSFVVDAGLTVSIWIVTSPGWEGKTNMMISIRKYFPDTIVLS